MSKVLYIKANPKEDDQSNTLRLSNDFIDEYKIHHPKDEVIILDLYEENLKYLDQEMINDLFQQKDTVMLNYAKQFADCDKYVIADPMWNLSIPAILKAYFDYVSYVGITFKYTEHGPIGLLKDQNKKAIHIVSRGGDYSISPMKELDFQTKYVSSILYFFGVTAQQVIAFEATNVLVGEALEEARSKIHIQAKEIAKTF